MGACLAATSSGQMQSISPVEFRSSEGQFFVRHVLGPTPSRTAQIHGDLPTMSIRRLTFRRDNRSQYDDRLPAFEVDCTLTMSSTPIRPARMSSSWAVNHGADRAVVIARKRMRMPPSQYIRRIRHQPDAFYQLTLDRPFAYRRPAALCWELTVFGSTLQRADAERLALDAVFAVPLSNGAISQGFVGRLSDGCTGRFDSAEISMFHRHPELALHWSATRGNPVFGSV